MRLIVYSKYSDGRHFKTNADPLFPPFQRFYAIQSLQAALLSILAVLASLNTFSVSPELNFDRTKPTRRRISVPNAEDGDAR